MDEDKLVRMGRELVLVTNVMGVFSKLDNIAKNEKDLFVRILNGAKLDYSSNEFNRQGVSIKWHAKSKSDSTYATKKANEEFFLKHPGLAIEYQAIKSKYQQRERDYISVEISSPESLETDEYLTKLAKLYDPANPDYVYRFMVNASRNTGSNLASKVDLMVTLER